MTFVRCGNRRASECESCSRLYAADMFQLVRAGVSGGKGVPASVGENPLVFATLTAPSFGPVHGTRPDHGRCRPRRDTGSRCAHGRPLSCMAIHDQDPDDALVGQPLCPDCYDYESAVVWQWWAPELWRRFTITLRRMLAHHLHVPPAHLGRVASVQYAKVAEYQRRGAVHFHALVRLDGPQTSDGFAPAPTRMAAPVLSALVEQAARAVRVTADPVHNDDVATGAGVRDPGRHPPGPDLSTAPTTPTGNSPPDRSPGTWPSTPPSPPPTPKPRTAPTCAACTPPPAPWPPALSAPTQDPAAPYGLLGRWAHTLGFRGHFATKSRRYSVTLGALRRARQRAQARIAEANRTGTPLDLREPRSRAPRRRRRADHRRDRVLGLRRHRMGQRRRNRPRHRSRLPSPRIRPGDSGMEAQGPTW